MRLGWEGKSQLDIHREAGSEKNMGLAWAQLFHGDFRAGRQRHVPGRGFIDDSNFPETR